MESTRQSKSGRKAMQKVFGTVEIFEAILLKLELLDLLLIQSVHSHFRNTIAGSPALQQKLFFAPAPDDHSPELNTVLATMFPPLLSLHRPKAPACLNSLKTICRQDWFDDPFYRARILRADASWRRMFPVQPPAKLDAIRIYAYDECLSSRERVVRAKIGQECQHLQDTGLRMGLLFDLAVHFDNVHSHATFFFHWQMFPLLEGQEEWQKAYHNVDEIGADQSDYDPLFSENQGTENSITMYYNYDACPSGSDTSCRELKVDSPFHSMVEKSPEILFKFRDLPGQDMEEYVPIDKRKLLK